MPTDYQMNALVRKLTSEIERLTAERDALREALAELLVTNETVFPDRPATARARAALNKGGEDE